MDGLGIYLFLSLLPFAGAFWISTAMLNVSKAPLSLTVLFCVCAALGLPWILLFKLLQVFQYQIERRYSHHGKKQTQK